MNDHKRICIVPVTIIVLAAALSMLLLSAAAATYRYYPDGMYFQSHDDTQHLIGNVFSVPQFSYGNDAIGRLSLSGSVNHKSTVNGFTAYSSDGPLEIGYEYYGGYQTKEIDNWNLSSDSGRSAAGITLSKDIDKGTLIIQKSLDGKTWQNALDPVQNLFTAKIIDRSALYTISNDELLSGTYFRVIVSYKMAQLIAVHEKFGPDDEIYDYLYCTEVYQFYACLGHSAITFRDLITGEEIESGATVDAGFIIDKNGSSDSVILRRDNGPATPILLTTTIREAGEYVIDEISPAGQKYSYRISVVNGLKVSPMRPTVSINQKKNGYSSDHPITGNTEFGSLSHSTLTIGQRSTKALVQANHNGFPAYGVTGENVYLFLRLQDTSALERNGWKIAADNWGQKKNELISGVQPGPVGSGALILQTSSDGLNWETEDVQPYSKGLFTTDYENEFGDKGDVLIYTPDGQRILNGIYIRILYAYEIAHAETKRDYRCVEEYCFYLCSNELDAVTFHNLSVTDQKKEICAEYDDATAEIISKAETMLSGAYTVSGFTIDTSLNPTVTYTVTRDGFRIAVPSNHTFTTSGKYEITLTSAVGTKRIVTIYVDQMNTHDALDYYFGDSFIRGKRIYSEGSYPIFEGGKSSYQIRTVDSNHIPLSGTITNLTSGEIATISPERQAKSAVIDSPGFYEVVLATNSGDLVSGDNRVFTFRFEIIAEGTAPGPVVNRRSLEDYAHTTITDSYPLYYGLTYQSASTGYITLAFASKEAALDFAYDFQKGMVEKQSDGSYRYNGLLIVTQKEKYDSAWDLTDAVYFFAEQAIHRGYFDLSNEFTILSLPDDVIKETDNLRTLELKKSVTIFAEGEKEKLTDLDAIPIISDKPYTYLIPGSSGHVDSGYYDFKFVKDKYGCDSDSVVIIDCNGKESARDICRTSR